jgi:mRNA degradation ribonuclease J1/J2
VISVRYERGVYLPNESIWLDPSDAKPFAFVSHAHRDHIAAHDEIVVSERTSRLLRAGWPCAFRQPELKHLSPRAAEESPSAGLA